MKTMTLMPETKDQKFYHVNGQLKAEIDVCITHQEQNAPSVEKCRHAVIPLNNKDKGYAVYDRFLCRIVNGVFRHLEDALHCAQSYNEHPTASQDMCPNGDALGLVYPETSKENTND
jgi:hypothetical protein